VIQLTFASRHSCQAPDAPEDVFTACVKTRPRGKLEDSNLLSLVSTGNSKRLTGSCESTDIAPMRDLRRLIWWAMVGLVRSRTACKRKSWSFDISSMC
jgi:hypothetical protein